MPAADGSADVFIPSEVSSWQPAPGAGIAGSVDPPLLVVDYEDVAETYGDRVRVAWERFVAQTPTRSSASANPPRSSEMSSKPRSGPNDMTATYTFDVYCTLDGFGSATSGWGGYWGKQGPELLDHRLALYNEEQRMVFGANTFRAFTRMLASSTEDSEVRDPWVTRMRNLPATVVSTTLEGPLDWPDATVVGGDAVDVVGRLKEESGVPLRSHGCLSMNRALMAAGLVDFVQVTLFPVITGQTGSEPIFAGAADFDLELIEARTLDRHIQELVYRPTLH